MADRLYYTDPYCRRFEAVVTGTFEHEGRLAVTLDRTAFYPTSGGQPFDTGRLGTAHVVDTIDADDVLHIVSAPLPRGTAVVGEIDWPRRFDHMQQHTGQHLVSAAFDRLFDNPTVSFHLGGDTSTIDLARDARAGDVERAVDAANEIVWENRPVSVRFVSQEEATALPLRKDPAREGQLRVIEIDRYDMSTCGGTHVNRTGAVGIIAVVGSERHRGGTRVTFVCGGRALRALRTYRDAVAGSVRTLSVLPAELPTAIERVQAESKTLQGRLKELGRRLAEHEGARLMAEAVDTGGIRVIAETLNRWDAGDAKSIAAAAAAHGRACVVLLSDETPVSIVIARSPDVRLDAQMVLRKLIERFGGRGGGKADLAQGGGLSAPAQEVVSAARALVDELGSG